jgi:FkbM family methyltransferase
MEMGAVNGVMFSNTRFFEDQLGWTGVLVEANPLLFEDLRKNRPGARCFSTALCAEEGKEFDFIGTTGTLAAVGAVTETMDDGLRKIFWGQQQANLKVKCRPLGKLLIEQGVRHVDFWSLDVEGAELEVIRTFDWSITVDVLLVELDGRNEKKDSGVRAVLRENGMRFAFCIDQNEVWERVARFPGPARGVLPSPMTRCFHRDDNVVPLLPITRHPTAKPLLDTAFPDAAFHSQWHEDRVIYNTYFSHPPRLHGVFMEMGAVNGVMFSNTRFFEDQLGWRGLEQVVDGPPATISVLSGQHLIWDWQAAFRSVSDFTLTENKVDLISISANVRDPFASLHL